MHQVEVKVGMRTATALVDQTGLRRQIRLLDQGSNRKCG
jgi:hypothetical protein